MSLATRILGAVQKAKTSIGDLVIQALVTSVVNGAYNTTTLKPSQTVVTGLVDGFVSEWTEAESGGDNIKFDDVKFYMFPTSMSVLPGHTVKVNGITYNLIKTSPVMVGSHVALTLLQLRK